MPRVILGAKHEPALDLSNSAEHIVVRTRSRKPLRAGPVQRPSAAQVADGQLVVAFPEAGVEVFRVGNQNSSPSIEARKIALRQDPDVQFAGRVLVDNSGEPVVYTENLFVKFRDTADPDENLEVLRAAGLTVREQLDYATNAYFVSAPEGTGQKVFEIAEYLLARDDVEYCHPELVRRKRGRTIYASQWHLTQTSAGGQLINAHANVAAAHATTRGAGVTIAIIDDGVDIDHPEFAAAGKVVSPRDVTFAETHAQAFNPRPKDLEPQYPENHGTACAGVACAAGIDGASGVAPDARLMPIRCASGLGSQQEANAFKWAADHGADVISCSWGPADGIWYDPSDPLHRERVPLPASTKLAIDYALTRGRQGKGCVVLFAAGNGNEAVENDGYASYSGVIAVAACNDRGTRSVYSDFGAAVHCAFPSSDSAWPGHHPAPLTPGIWTTDRVSRRGYNPGATSTGDVRGNYTNSFGGTSSSAPGAAGVVALALAVNPQLTAADVKDILRRGSDRIDPQGGQYDASGRSRYYGYGRLNAASVVQLARPVNDDLLVISRKYNLALPDLQSVDVTLDVQETVRVDRVCVDIELKHTYIGDLLISVIPPAEMRLPEVVLHNRSGGSTHDLKRAFNPSNTPKLAQFNDRVCTGRWTLRIRDQAAADSGTLLSFALTLFLRNSSAPRQIELPTEAVVAVAPAAANAR